MADGFSMAPGPRYGAMPGPGPELVAKLPRGDLLVDAVPKRKRLSILAIPQVAAMPVGIFVGVLWVNSFILRFEHPGLSTFLTVCGLIVGVICGAKSFQVKSRAAGSGPDWLLFLCTSCLIAWLAGLILGIVNFSGTMKGYYELKGLAVFKDVHPSDIPATKYMDAAAIYFKPGTKVSQSLSLGFKSGSTYCVAPIVSGNASDAPPASYDFWAVGLDCCVPMPPASFTCGPALDPTVHAAIRWMGTGARDYFKLGINQAQAEYSYMAANPVFFKWTKDPEAEIEQLFYDGKYFFAVSCIVFASLQALATMTVAFYFARQLTSKVPTIP